MARARPADIFLSYAREDVDVARRLASALHRAGWRVWWDHHLGAGEDFEHAIVRALVRTRCVVVLWSSSAVQSKWVQREAEVGRQSGRLLPVLIEAGVVPRGRFRRLHAIDLSRWQSSSTNGHFRRLVATLTERLGFRRRALRSPARIRIERRAFSVAPREYEEFRVQVARRTALRVQLFATRAVSVSLLDSDDHRQLADRDLATFPTTVIWSRKRELDQVVWVDKGVWWIVVEGNASASAGVVRIAIRH
jgi:hypothetical protein